MTTICVVASFFFLLLKTPNPTYSKSIPILKENSAITDSIRESTTNLSQIVDSAETSIRSDIFETWKLLISSRMLKLAPIMIYTALS